MPFMYEQLWPGDIFHPATADSRTSPTPHIHECDGTTCRGLLWDDGKQHLAATVQLRTKNDPPTSVPYASREAISA